MSCIGRVVGAASATLRLQFRLRAVQVTCGRTLQAALVLMPETLVMLFFASDINADQVTGELAHQ
jgi:hypothetical protein